MQCFYILSGHYTIILQASLVSNLGGVFIVIYRFIMRQPIHRLEYLGVVFAFLGSSISVSDEDAQKVDTENQNVMLGNLFGILSALSTAVCYTYLGKIVKEEINPSLISLIEIVTSTI